MARIMALDYGTKRVGVAVTDPLQIVANGLDTIHSKDILEFVKNYVAQEEVEAIVVGMPKNLKNEPTHATQHVVGFERKLRSTFPNLHIETIDERFTSKIAFDAMIAGGMKKKDRRNKATIDKLSAVVILQSYLEMRSL